MTIRQLKLVYLGENNFKVIVVKNSTEYRPREVLSDAEVEELCADKTWDVVIVGPLKK